MYGVITPLIYPPPMDNSTMSNRYLTHVELESRTDTSFDVGGLQGAVGGFFLPSQIVNFSPWP